MSQLIQTLKVALAGAESQGLSELEVREVIGSIVADDDRELNTEDAAAFLGYSQPTLKLWRYNGKGPKYRKDEGGRIRYTIRRLKEHQRAGE